MNEYFKGKLYSSIYIAFLYFKQGISFLEMLVFFTQPLQTQGFLTSLMFSQLWAVRYFLR